MDNKQMTNLEMLLWGIQHIAENHKFEADTENWQTEGEICIYGGCNVPTLSDVRMLCEDCKVPFDNIESSEFGIDVYLPNSPRWAKSKYKKPFHEFWRRMQ